MSDDKSHLLMPLFLIAAVLIAVIPWLHPVGTCTHWLEKWGEASEHSYWVAIHKLAMIGFALAGGAGLLLATLSPKSMTSMFAGAAMGGGFFIAAISNLIHATAASSLGRAYRAATDPAAKTMIRTMAESFVAYDVGATSASSALITAGCCALVVALYRRRVLSAVPAAILFGLALVWTFQYHGIFSKLGFSLSEAIHWASLALYLASIGLILWFRTRVVSANAAALPPPATAGATAE